MEMVLETTATRAYRSLRHRILNNDLKPGQQLPQQRLAKQLGIGTVPLREAMVRLECEGLVESVPQWGARVRVWTLERWQHLFDLRVAIELQTARLCAERATDRELEELMIQASELDAFLDATPQDFSQIAARDAALHQRIAELARSPLLLEQFERAHVLGQMVYLTIRYTADVIQEPPHPHVDLVKALASRNLNLVRETMQWHLECARNEVQAQAKEWGLIGPSEGEE
jgi:DNA-binding GntR family transcriptional regulator